jgi:hypothetical protein
MRTRESGAALWWFLYFAAALLLAPAFSLADESPKKTDDPYAVVASASLFAIGGVGYAGRTTDAETALREIVKQKDGVKLCRKLLEEKNLAAQLYGLLGLKLLGDKVFAEAYPRFEKSKTMVKTASGCELYEDSVAVLAKEIRDRKVE